MAKLYEFEVSREVVERMVDDMDLSTPKGARGGALVDKLIETRKRPGLFLRTTVGGKPGFRVHLGDVRTDRFSGEGLHMITHSGSEGVLDAQEFDRQLKSSLDRQGVIYEDKS